jgi:hypothetical protein
MGLHTHPTGAAVRPVSAQNRRLGRCQGVAVGSGLWRKLPTAAWVCARWIQFKATWSRGVTGAGGLGRLHCPSRLGFLGAVAPRSLAV